MPSRRRSDDGWRAITIDLDRTAERSASAVTDGTQGGDLAAGVAKAREELDAHVREMVSWHFSPETGSPFWLEYAAAELDWR